MKLTRILALLVAVGYAATAVAANDFVPLAPISSGGEELTGQASLVAYVNTFFQLAIGLGAVAAVFKIGQAGFIYMLQDTSAGKMLGSKDSMWSAIKGLILLILVYLILYVINPNIVNLNLLT